MLKRELHTDSVNALLDRLTQEHDLFYYKMLSSPPKVIYESCGKIRFYDSVYEYFQYKEELDPEYVEACLKETHILEGLYNLYLKHENLRVATWDDIEEMLDKEADVMLKKDDKGG